MCRGHGSARALTMILPVKWSAYSRVFGGLKMDAGRYDFCGKEQKHYLPKHCEHHTMMAFRRCQWAVNGVRRVRALSDTAAVTPPAKVSRYLSPHIAHRLLCTASPSPLALLPFCSFRVLRAPTRAFLSPASRLWIHGLSSNNSG